MTVILTSIARTYTLAQSVSMEQYVFKPLEEDRYSFKAMRLSRLTIKVGLSDPGSIDIS